MQAVRRISGKIAIWFLVIFAAAFGAQTTDIMAGEPFTIGLNTTTTLNGRNITLYVSITDPLPIGTFDLLLWYNADILNFIKAERFGELNTWEYFTYRYGLVDPAGEPNIGYVRLIGIADMNNGQDPGDVYRLSGEIIELTFYVSEDRTLVGECTTLYWSWPNCNENVLQSVGRDTAFYAHDISALLPQDSCLFADDGAAHIPVVHFRDGRVGIIPPEAMEKGDYNGDGTINGIDAIYWISYVFYNGPAPVYSHGCGGFCQADFNCDLKINLVDLACFIRYVYRQPAPGPCNPCPEG